MTAATWVMTAFGVMWFFWSTFRTFLSTVRWKESNSAWYAFHTLSLIIWVFYNLFRVLLNIVVYIHPSCRKEQHHHTHHRWILGTPESPYRSNISENTLYRDLDLGPLHIGLMNMMKTTCLEFLCRFDHFVFNNSTNQQQCDNNPYLYQYCFFFSKDWCFFDYFFNK